jgi:hypothetical protein
MALATRRKRPSVVARPSSILNLTRKERAILADPDWVTEDEADVIYAMRHEHEPSIPLEEVAKEFGLPLEG